MAEESEFEPVVTPPSFSPTFSEWSRKGLGTRIPFVVHPPDPCIICGAKQQTCVHDNSEGSE